jgi:succinate dehydrogenase / fumarate reductase flavoprotein subunit
LVFGSLAGKGAAEYANGLSAYPEVSEEDVNAIIKNATDILNRESGENPYLLHEELQATMQENVSIVRIKDDLEKGIEELEKIKAKYDNIKAPGASQFNPGWHEALSLRNLLITTEAVARAALMREESRGSHSRVDFPGESAEWLKYNIVLRKGGDGKMDVRKVERPEPDAELKRIGESVLEELEKEVAEDHANGK